MFDVFGLVEALGRLSEVPPTLRLTLRRQAAHAWGAAVSADGADDLRPVRRAQGGGGPLRGPISSIGGDAVGLAERAAAALSALDLGSMMLVGEPDAGVIATWAFGAQAKRPWAEVELQQLRSNELWGRLGGALALTALDGRGTAPLTAAGVAYAAAWAEGLGPRRTAEAITLAIHLAPRGAPGTRRRADRVAVAAEAARAGARAASYVAEGLQGPASTDFDPAIFGSRPAATALAEVGSRWCTASIHLRQAPGSAHAASALWALELCLTEHQDEIGRALTVADVARVDFDVPLLPWLWEGVAEPAADDAARLDAAMLTASIRRLAALRLASGPLAAQSFSADRLARHASAYVATVSRVHVHHDAKATAAQWECAKEDFGIDRWLGGPTQWATLLAGRPGAAATALTDLPVSIAADLGAVLGEAVPQAGATLRRFAESGPDPATVDLAADTLSKFAGWASRALSRPIRPMPRVSTVRGGLWPARVRVLLQGGRVREAEVLTPPGGSSSGRESLRTLALRHLPVGSAWLHAASTALDAESSELGWPGHGPDSLLSTAVSA